jgi:hypothetical protein
VRDSSPGASHGMHDYIGEEDGLVRGYPGAVADSCRPLMVADHR